MFNMKALWQKTGSPDKELDVHKERQLTPAGERCRVGGDSGGAVQTKGAAKVQSSGEEWR